ncbi:hypothetical protein RRG08_038022 [Elysia crispata]|uniref:Uncharacterized protein n=1 Tax=Elysia crispata TaxID=231223 RepID=A0AAE0ZYT3_9GAST|nr:hypothetical protein RRG08_038022 [Elysia crispata]
MADCVQNFPSSRFLIFCLFALNIIGRINFQGLGILTWRTGTVAFAIGKCVAGSDVNIYVTQVIVSSTAFVTPQQVVVCQNLSRLFLGLAA